MKLISSNKNKLTKLIVSKTLNITNREKKKQKQNPEFKAQKKGMNSIRPDR